MTLLPVDCLFGRSSFGKTLSRQNILEQWEENVSAAVAGGQEAFVVTRRQRALEETQLRADDSLSKKETKRESPEEGDLQTLFQGKIPEEKGKENSENVTVVTEPEKDNFPVNILDRNRNQLIVDQTFDVTLEKIRRKAFQKVPEESDGYFFTNDLLFHRKYLSDEHNGTRYVDRIVVPESYRNEILRVEHTIPSSGHMGSKKTFDQIASHFSWPGLSFDVRKYCATCLQCQLVARKLKSKRVPIKPVENVTEPFKKIAVDIVGELPTILDKSTCYSTAICIFFCHFSVPS